MSRFPRGTSEFTELRRDCLGSREEASGQEVRRGVGGAVGRRAGPRCLAATALGR